MCPSSNKLSLYEIGETGLFIQNALIDAEGELLPEIEERINALMIEAPSRIDAAGHVLQELEHAAAACEIEKKRLADRQKWLEGNVDKLRSLMTNAIDMAFNGKLKLDTATYWTQKAKDSVSFELAEEMTLEQLQAERPDFVRTKLELNKAEIQAAYDREEPLPDSIFCNKTTGKRYLRWK